MSEINWDINNYEILQAGADARRMNDGGGWQPIATAPRDGTVIELRCTWGVAPHYNIFQWKKSEWGEERWCKVGDESMGISEDLSWSWRPYMGNPETYSDPTGGAQNSPAYWRGAVAAKYGQPLDMMEADTFRNTTKKTPEKPSRLRKWWKSLDFG